MELQKDDVKMLQGLCALAMIFLHLFNREYQGLFNPMLFIKGIPLSYYVSLLCDFCVMGYAFCSGYAHTKLYENRDEYQQNSIKRLRRLLIKFWIVLVVFSIISILTGNSSYMPGSFKKFISNAFLLENSYNGAWWYLFAYVVIVIVSPTILCRITNSNAWKYLVIGFGIYAIAYYIRFKVQTDNWILIKLGPLGMTLFEYVLGIVCCKIHIFTKLYKVWTKIPEHVSGIFVMCTLAMMMFIRTLILPSLFVAPVTGFVIIVCFHFWNKSQIVRKFFLYLGKHSTNIWLTHMFFYAELFKNFVYVAKYPILILGLMLVFTFAMSSILMSIEKIVIKIMRGIK